MGAVAQALAEARSNSERPTLIICRTVIGAGSPGRVGTAKAHREALGAAMERDWQRRFEAFRQQHPQLAAEFERRVLRRELPQGFELLAFKTLAITAQRQEAVATRKASQQLLVALAPQVPELFGGSANKLAALVLRTLAEEPLCNATS